MRTTLFTLIFIITSLNNLIASPLRDRTILKGSHYTLAEKPNRQTGYVIQGKVTNVNHQAIDYATIIIKKINSGKVIQSTFTDSIGSFQLNVSEKGEYLIGVSAIGTFPLSISLTLGEQQQVKLPDIILTANVSNLKEVVVTGKKAYIEQKLDRTVINVGSLISNDGANALEVLEKSPGVVVDGNGNISFKGKSGVTVFIDGKPSYLSGNSLANYLKSLPSSVLDQLELMDNPPAKYDAAGNSGVINIKTKKSKIKGFNGSLSANLGQAHYTQTSQSLNLNYRINKINIFSNAAYSLNHSYRKLNLGRNYFDSNGNFNSAFEQIQYIKSKTNAANLKIGMDYYLSPKTTWGIVFTGAATPGKVDNPSDNRLLNNTLQLDSLITANNKSKNRFYNGGINLNYSHQFDSLGKQLTFDLDYLNYNSRINQTFINQSFGPDCTLTNTQIIKDNLPTNIHISSARADYTLPLNKGAKLEAGAKGSYVNTDNEANYFNERNGTSTIDYNLTNRFTYKENVNAIYLNLNKNFNRLSLQLGLRLENTNAKGHQTGNPTRKDSSFVKNYTNLFPTAYFSYKLDSSGTNLLIVSYGRRIRRPYYQDLNPFITLSDKFTYSSGNPFLKPQYSDNYKLSYSYKSTITAALYYNHITDIQNEIVRQEGNIFINGTGNIGTATYLGASVNLALQPTKWWFLNTYIQVFRNNFKGQLFSSYIDQSSTFGEINLTNQFTLPQGWSAEIGGFYITRRANGQFINYANGQLNAGIQKKILNNNGSVKLNARDLLNTYTTDGIANYIPNATSSFRNRYNSQVFTLGFTYNFAQSKNGAKKRKTGSVDVEKDRVKTQ
ncbi:outer membrane beta-barrel family protein [Pedobacter steynii]|uniref:Outer membrane protein beta-barrel domain-containing protein n=1 Tax=Pedobacter steynii TaxID=430522 RepID=A0A1D7QJF4_9SPHI|nr:outer membrane beta-barrel family protein [Pedobacter steynii]AOM78749.1 hypothetical protein BFS30_17150 [Pedobacter steynii]